jgi:hypothetical protein
MYNLMPTSCFEGERIMISSHHFFYFFENMKGTCEKHTKTKQKTCENQTENMREPNRKHTTTKQETCRKTYFLEL